MRKDIQCAFCRATGDGSGPAYYSSPFLLAVRPNTLTLPKGWVCRTCLEKYAKLSDREFLNKFNKAIQRKP